MSERWVSSTADLHIDYMLPKHGQTAGLEKGPRRECHRVTLGETVAGGVRLSVNTSSEVAEPPVLNFSYEALRSGVENHALIFMCRVIQSFKLRDIRRETV